MANQSSVVPAPGTEAGQGDVSRYRIRFLAEGFGESEGELIRFQSPMTVDNLANALPFEGRCTLEGRGLFRDSGKAGRRETPKQS